MFFENIAMQYSQSGKTTDKLSQLTAAYKVVLDIACHKKCALSDVVAFPANTTIEN